MCRRNFSVAEIRTTLELEDPCKEPRVVSSRRRGEVR